MDTIPAYIYKITTTKQDYKQQELVFWTFKFIFNALIDSGLSSALIKHISESKVNNYIIVIPTTNITNDFYHSLDYN